MPVLTGTYSLLTDKRFDSIIRRTMGYGIVTTLFVLMSSVTSISIYSRLTNESNIDYLKDGVEKVVTFYKNNTLPKSIEENIEKPRIKIDSDNLAINN